MTIKIGNKLSQIETNVDANVWDEHKVTICMNCKQGFVHNYSYYSVLGKRMCNNCGQEEK